MWLLRGTDEWIERDTAEPWVTKGYTVKTQQERDDFLASKQAAADAAAAEAALLATLPATFATGVAVQDDNGNWQEFVPVGADVLAIQISNSPLDPATRDALKAAAVAELQAEETARQAAIDELGLTQAQITAVKAYFDADTDALFSNLNANQRNFLKVQQALVTMLTKREVGLVR